ncbi:hypothetical protein [Helicobacter pylori]|uniref:hypothetical protein n=1 Tax=Helicobacter pylori TaxID=210 RepID=UPI00026B4F1D|nr:hypothetical protein [Helicobacter pylori]EJC55129.1 hypothetical protein HPHPP62_0897 [Helicobacter pylori Hp P-62]
MNYETIAESNESTVVAEFHSDSERKNERKKFKILILKTSPKIGDKAVCNDCFMARRFNKPLKGCY